MVATQCTHRAHSPNGVVNNFLCSRVVVVLIFCSHLSLAVEIFTCNARVVATMRYKTRGSTCCNTVQPEKG